MHVIGVPSLAAGSTIGAARACLQRWNASVRVHTSRTNDEADCLKRLGVRCQTAEPHGASGPDACHGRAG